MNMTVELFDNIINTSQDCVFWKDSERRFLGVNRLSTLIRGCILSEGKK